jgi:hypothetical protein
VAVGFQEAPTDLREVSILFAQVSAGARQRIAEIPLANLSASSARRRIHTGAGGETAPSQSNP